MERKTFNATELAAAADINPSTLRTWRKRGFLPIEKEHERAWTLYTPAQALEVCLLAALIRSGFDPSFAKQIVDGYREQGEAESQWDKPLQAIVFNSKKNIDKPRKPEGFEYEILFSSDLDKLLSAARKRTSGDDDVTWFLIDMVKLMRRAKASLLGGAR